MAGISKLSPFRLLAAFAAAAALAVGCVERERVDEGEYEKAQLTVLFDGVDAPASKSRVPFDENAGGLYSAVILAFRADGRLDARESFTSLSGLTSATLTVSTATRRIVVLGNYPSVPDMVLASGFSGNLALTSLSATAGVPMHGTSADLTVVKGANSVTVTLVRDVAKVQVDRIKLSSSAGSPAGIRLMAVYLVNARSDASWTMSNAGAVSVSVGSARANAWTGSAVSKSASVPAVYDAVSEVLTTSGTSPFHFYCFANPSSWNSAPGHEATASEKSSVTNLVLEFMDGSSVVSYHHVAVPAITANHLYHINSITVSSAGGPDPWSSTAVVDVDVEVAEWGGGTDVNKTM